MPAAIVALPMTLVIVCGEIDVSVGSMVGLCAATIAVCREQDLSIETSMLASLIVGTLAGALNGAIIAFIGLPSLVVTIGTLALDRGIAQILLKERGVTGFPDWYQEIGFGTVGNTPIPWSSLIFVAFFAVFAVFLHASYRGRALFAIGNNREATRFSGINVKGAVFGVFVTSGMMCSVAAVVLTSYLSSARSDTAIGLELPVITAVVSAASIFLAAAAHSAACWWRCSCSRLYRMRWSRRRGTGGAADRDGLRTGDDACRVWCREGVWRPNDWPGSECHRRDKTRAHAKNSGSKTCSATPEPQLPSWRRRLPAPILFDRQEVRMVTVDGDARLVGNDADRRLDCVNPGEGREGSLQRGSNLGSDSMLMQFALTVNGESAGNRHHGSWNHACSVRARH